MIFVQSLENKKFPGSSVVKVCHFHCRGPRSIPGQGTKRKPCSMVKKKKKKKKNKKKPGKYYLLGFPGGSVLKKPVCNAGDSGLIPGSGLTY